MSALERCGRQRRQRRGRGLDQTWPRRHGGDRYFRADLGRRLSRVRRRRRRSGGRGGRRSSWYGLSRRWARGSRSAHGRRNRRRRGRSGRSQRRRNTGGRRRGRSRYGGGNGCRSGGPGSRSRRRRDEPAFKLKLAQRHLGLEAQAERAPVADRCGQGSRRRSRRGGRRSTSCRPESSCGRETRERRRERPRR